MKSEAEIKEKLFQKQSSIKEDWNKEIKHDLAIQIGVLERILKEEGK